MKNSLQLSAQSSGLFFVYAGKRMLMKPNLSVIDFFEQEKAAREGAFPAAALAGEPEAFAFSNGERYIVNRFVAASVMFCQIADKKNGFC